MDSVTPPPSSWKESLSQLKHLLNESSKTKVEKCCANILQLDKLADNASHALPDGVRATVTTIYLRALIHSGKYAAVVDHCKDQSAEARDDNALEEAYALYRLRKYDACRKLCSRHVEHDGKHPVDNYKGIVHIYAQTLYRMGETREADAVYRKILDGRDSKFAEMDADEREDVLANALANRTANYTAGSLLLSNDNSSWVEKVEEIVSLLQSYGTEDISPVSKEGEQDILQNYDLAYNLATYLLVSSDARSRRSIAQAKRLLTHAEKSALTLLESTSSPNNDEDDNADLTEEERTNKQQSRKQQQQQQQQLAEKEAMPIRANIAYANVLLGGEENEKDAMRTFLTCLMEGTKQKKNKGGAGGVEANLLAAASNNLAFLRDGKESVFDVLKRIPTACSSSVSEDGGAGKGGGGTSAVPLVGATPQQVRTVMFNRSLQLAKMGNASGCLEALAVLRASLKISYRGDDAGEKESKASAENSSPKRNAKGKKKKAAVTTESTNDALNDISLIQQDVPTAQPSSDVEAVAWNARADWVESELRKTIGSDNKKPDDIINSAIATLDSATKVSNVNDEAAGALAFMKAQILLHNSALTNGQTKPQLLIPTLESLPPLIQACPGTTVTMASLHGALHKDEYLSRSVEIMSSLGDDISARLAIAEFCLERYRFDDSLRLLEGVLDEEDVATTDQFMTATALIVRALSYTDPEKAEVYAETLREACTDSGLDGEKLEAMEIPMFAKKAVSPGSGGRVANRSLTFRKISASTGSKQGPNHGEQKKKKNREAILRKRAKQRDAYLKELESKGLYDPNKVPQTKPDPERWIPKSQRSYNRRGRRGRYNSNIGAQGGGAGAGMEKDAAKLDVAARVAAAKTGATDGTGKLSTASMQVSGGPVKKGKPSKRR